MECLFCKIVQGEIPAELIAENDGAVAIRDINPLTKGHAVVLPKEHAETILELSDEQVGHVFRLVKETAEKLKETYHPQGFTLGINHGKVAGQAIRHLHIHIIPRYKGDGGGNIHNLFR